MSSIAPTTPSPPAGPRYARIWAYFWAHWGYFAIGAGFLLATNLLAMQIPRELGGAVQLMRDADLSSVPLDLDAIASHTWAIALLAIGAAGVRILSRIFVFNGGRLIEFKIRSELFDHLTKLSQRFFQSAATGDLVSRVGNDVTYIRAFYGFSLLNLVNTIVAFVIALFKMNQVSTELMLYALAPYPIFFISMAMFTRALYNRTQAVQATLADISARAQENVSGAQVVKAFGIEQEETRAFAVASERYVEANLSLARVRSAMMPYLGVIPALGSLTVLAVGGHLVITEALELGEFVEFTGYVAALTWPTAAIGWGVMSWYRGMAAFDRLLQILNTTSTITDPAPADTEHLPLVASGGIAGRIEIDGVGLEYEDGTRALSDITLTIEPGERVAVVGRTGSGKSSLMDLLPRLRDPTEGEIRIDGVPLRRLPLVELRRHIGYTPQDSFLFSTTIEDNIRFGLLGREERASTQTAASRITVDDAVRIAHLTDDLPAFPEGLQTVVGERGITLSGGQKQRVTIARAVILDPSILILDDALSSVDTATERRILSELGALMQGRTSILVTHRFNALELVDKIVVMEDGRIIEVGTHADLLARGGAYAGMVERQRIAEELAAS